MAFARGARLHAPILVGLTFAVAAAYLVAGAGFVLDDWYFLRNAQLDGIAHVAGPTGGDRPVGALTWMATFGAMGRHPAPIILTMAALNATTGVLFAAIVRRHLGPRIAVIAAVAWVIAPVRTALEAWMSTVAAVTAQTAAMTALWIVARPEPRSWQVAAAASLAALAVLSYESSVALVLMGVVLVRIVPRRSLDPRVTLPVAGAALAGLGWAVTHWNPGRTPRQLQDLSPVVSANFGWGIASSDAVASGVVLAVAVGVVLVAWRATQRAGAPSQMIAVGVGLVVLVGGALPFALYKYEPLGAGDRLNWISAFGGALVWAGLLDALWSARREAGALAAAGLVAAAVAVRADRTAVWATAGRDADRVAHAVVSAHPSPATAVTVGPRPITMDNIAGFADDSNVRAAVHLLGRVSPARRDALAPSRALGRPAAVGGAVRSTTVVRARRPRRVVIYGAPAANGGTRS